MKFNMSMDQELPYLPNYKDSLDFNAILRVALATPVNLEISEYQMYSEAMTKDNN